MKKILLFAAVISVTIAKSQTSTREKFQWVQNPKLHTISKDFADAEAVYINDDRIIEYTVEKDGFFVYKTTHRIVHLNNDKGIESWNRIYLPANDVIELSDVAARTILPSGKVIDFDKTNIKDVKEDGGTYKIFALSGLTKDCEIEYFFTVKKFGSYFGKELISSSMPVEKAHFELISPRHLLFNTRSYNGFPEAHDSTYLEKRHISADAVHIMDAHDEKYSMYKSSLQRIEYKFSYNLDKNAKERLFTWDEYAKRVYALYNNISDKDQKKIKDLFSEINFADKSMEAGKITAIENFVKKNFICRDDISSDDAEDLAQVIKSKIGSEKAICKLFIGLLNQSAVQYQIVLAGDREDYKVDRSFENWDNARHFLFYFPSEKKFFAPTEAAYRYPWIPPTWAGSNALYCVTTTIGNFTAAIGEIKLLPLEDATKSFVNMDMTLQFDKDDTLLIDVKQSYGGYAMPEYKAPFVFLSDEDQNKTLKEMVKFGTNSENIITSSFENKEIETPDPYKPFVINAKVKSANLVERAGPKLLVKIGEVIGEQEQLYDTKPRVTDVELFFAHSLIRNINFTIPEGFKIKNPQDLKFNVQATINNKPDVCFISDYTQTGNLLHITIREEYKSIFYPLEQYEEFKKVINASADFNKVVLILEKQ